MTSTEQFFDWLEHTDFSLLLRGESLLVFPLILTIHTICMGLIAGTSWAIDFRILGVAPNVPVPAMAKLFPVLWVSLAVNFITGTLLFFAYPYKAFSNWVFYLKLSLIALAIYLVVRIRKEVLLNAHPNWQQARYLAAASIVSWAGAVTAGRLLAYTFKWLRVGIPGGF